MSRKKPKKPKKPKETRGVSRGMLSLDPVHQNSGGVTAAVSGTPVAVSLAGGETTETGGTLIAFLAGGIGQQFTAPAGWEIIGSLTTASDASGAVYLRGPAQGLAAGESSWNFSPVNATPGPARWTVLEYAGIASHATIAANVYDVVSNSGACTAFTSGTTAGVDAPLSSVYDGLAISIHYSYNPTGTDTWTGHTDQFGVIATGSQAGSGSNNVTLSVSGLPVQRIGTHGSTATCSRTLNSTNAGYTLSFVLVGDGSRRAAHINYIEGAEHGTITGNTLGPANNLILATVTAGVSVSATAKRSGNYGYLLSSSAAACNYTLGVLQVGGPTYRRHFRFPTLPAADTEFWAYYTVRFRFIQSTGKIGCTVGTGSEVVSSAAITANQWFGIDVFRDSGATFADWAVDYNAELTDTTPAVAQTRATGSAGSSVHRVGWATSLTATLHVDDGAGAAEQVHYPIGDIRVLPMKVDPAGTPTISGTTTNFGVMTNNGTVAAWNAVNARNAIDDVPPDLSGTRDAAVCLLAHASDYAEFPFEPLDLAAAGVGVRGVRWIACLWAASATTATIRIKIFDGTAEIAGAQYGEADPGADNAATPVWVTRMIKPTLTRQDWTQAMVSALALRMGSNDATPDIGVDMILAEVAVVPSRPEELVGSAGDPIHVTVGRDPDTNAIIDLDATTVGAGATVDYELDGTPQTQIVVAADDTEHRDIGGVDFQSVNRIDVVPD